MDFDVKMHVTKKGVFFPEGFASPEGPGPGPASQEEPGLSPYGPTWAHIGQLWAPIGPTWAYVVPGHSRTKPATELIIF